MAKVFIVEDNKEIRRVYERAFHLGGYEVECHEDGKKAAEQLQSEKETPSVILLDVILPSMSGIDLLRLIKADERLKHIPIMVLTNSMSGEDEQLFLSLGADRYLIKLDTNPSAIVQEVDTLIGRKPTFSAH